MKQINQTVPKSKHEIHIKYTQIKYSISNPIKFKINKNLIDNHIQVDFIKRIEYFFNK